MTLSTERTELFTPGGILGPVKTWRTQPSQVDRIRDRAKGDRPARGVSCDFFGHRTKTDLPPNEGLRGEGEKSRENPPHEGGVRVQTYNSEEGRAVSRTTPPLEADAAKPSWLTSTDVEVLDHK